MPLMAMDLKRACVSARARAPWKAHVDNETRKNHATASCMFCFDGKALGDTHRKRRRGGSETTPPNLSPVPNSKRAVLRRQKLRRANCKNAPRNSKIVQRFRLFHARPLAAEIKHVELTYNIIPIEISPGRKLRRPPFPQSRLEGNGCKNKC